MGVSDRFRRIATGQRTRSRQGFYRILGTIAGVLVSIALVFRLAQYGELFVAALAVWICFCNFAARAVRNFASYGFQLAGYTVAIIGIPAALNPAGAYPLVVARFTEILLGIVCAALVSRLILARELSPRLVELVRALTRRADSFATLLLTPMPTASVSPPSGPSSPRLIWMSRPCSIRRISRASRRAFSTSRCAG